MTTFIKINHKLKFDLSFTPAFSIIYKLYGIPLYFRYLVNNYDNILSHHKNIPQTDNLYLDLNCAIHYCCREVLKEFPYQKTKHVSLEHKMIQNVIHYIELPVVILNLENYLHCD